MEKENKKILIKPKPEFKKELEIKKETMVMLILASLLGILANLVANIIENFFIKNKEYSLTYSLIVILSFVIILILLITIFWKWKYLVILYKQKRLLKKAQRILSK